MVDLKRPLNILVPIDFSYTTSYRLSINSNFCCTV